MINALTTHTVEALTGAGVAAVVDLFTASQDRKPTTRDLYARTVSAFFAWVATSGRTVDRLTVADIIA